MTSNILSPLYRPQLPTELGSPLKGSQFSMKLEGEGDLIAKSLSEECTNPNTLNQHEKYGEFSFNVAVGKVQDSSVVVCTDDHHTIEMPACLFPADVHPGYLFKVTMERDMEAEAERREFIVNLQQEILDSS